LFHNSHYRPPTITHFAWRKRELASTRAIELEDNAEDLIASRDMTSGYRRHFFLKSACLKTFRRHRDPPSKRFILRNRNSLLLVFQKVNFFGG
jgi:hypothetical protein